MEFKDWISDIANADWMIYIKRLSANDTGATQGHQVGVYFPKHVLSAIFPSIDRIDIKNPDINFTAVISSDNVPEHQLRAIYYNGKKFGEGTRNEKRITNWKKGLDYTPLQDEEKTGTIALFAFNNVNADSEFMDAWVCRNIEEEEYLEERIGEVDPQSTYFERGDIVLGGILSTGDSVVSQKYPLIWNEEFPTGATIINYLFEQGFHANLAVDKRILKRRNHEFDLFKLVEHYHIFPMIQKGFDNVEEFVKLANSISNRRKSRSGRSLELHLENIFYEENLKHFGVQCKTEGNKKPDFLFPNCSSYHDSSYPDDKLQVLAVKTTVKDRWRQILNEANRINTRYLFTLQKGVSENQFREMQEEQVKLVVPSPLHKSFPEPIRNELLSLSNFIEQTKRLYE